MEEQEKKKESNVTSFKPGQSGNPAGRPKVYKNVDELKAEIFKRTQIYISGKMWRDLEEMTALKRFEGMMKLMGQFLPELGTPDQSQNPNIPPQINVVFGTPQKQEIIELKEKQDGEYE